MENKNNFLKILNENKWLIQNYNLSLLNEEEIKKISEKGLFLNKKNIRKINKKFVIFDYCKYNIKIVNTVNESKYNIFIIEKILLLEIIENNKNFKINETIKLIETKWNWFEDFHCKSKIFEFFKINSKLIIFKKNENLKILKNKNLFILLKGNLIIQKEYNKKYNFTKYYNKNDYLELFLKDNLIKNKIINISEIINFNLIKEENLLNKINCVNYKVTSDICEIMEVNLENLNSYFSYFNNKITKYIKTKFQIKLKNRFNYFYNEIIFINKITNTLNKKNDNRNLKLKYIHTFKYNEIVSFHKNKVKNLKKNKTEKSISKKNYYFKISNNKSNIKISENLKLNNNKNYDLFRKFNIKIK